MEKKFKVGLIRVLTTEDQDILLAHEKLLNQYFQCLRWKQNAFPTSMKESILRSLALLQSPNRGNCQKLRDMDMIIVSCADDPGVEEIREALPGIPVTGGGETTLALARKYGEKIGVTWDYRLCPQSLCKT